MMGTLDLAEPVALLAEALQRYRATVSASDPLEDQDAWEDWAARAGAWLEGMR